ncbi:uncharacterized protein [Triticum aestivum]|uniref:uncharacterized protein n=1 Tax=Triticum aestivum TaxID=4565 RepID=UPI001D02944A|nr:uncharacterized protein LOC123129715 [Triticum aestivum]
MRPAKDNDMQKNILVQLLASSSYSIPENILLPSVFLNPKELLLSLVIARSRSVSTRSCRAMSCVSGKPAAGHGSTKETRGSGGTETEGDAHMLDPLCRTIEFFECF